MHGEYRHLVAHARAGPAMGVPADHVWSARTATRSRSPTTGLKPLARVPAGYLYVDGIVGDVGHGVLRDRRVLADEGVVVVIVGVDVKTGAIITGPEVITRAGSTPRRPRTCSRSARTWCATRSRRRSPGAAPTWSRVIR